MAQHPTYEELVKRIQQLEQQEAELKSDVYVRELAVLQNLGLVVNASLSFLEVSSVALRGIMEAVRPDIAFFFLRDGESLLLQETLPPDAWHTLGEIPEHKVGECLCGLTVSEGRLIYSRDIHNDFRCSWEECKKAGITSFASLPLKKGEEVIGVIGLASAADRDFEAQSGFLEALAQQISLALANAQLFESVQHELQERLKAEKSLQISENKYRQLIETTDTGYVILDEHGYVVDANQKYVFLTGRDRLDDVIGHQVLEWTALHDQERNAQEVEKCIKQGFVHNLELDYMTPSGKIIPVEINATVLQDSRPFRILSLCRDIIERKKTEEKISNSNRLLQTIVNTAPCRIFFKDLDLRYMGCNDAFAKDAGLTCSDDLIGKDDYQLVWKDQADFYRDDDRRVIDSGIPKLSYDEPQTTPEGNQIWLRTSKVPLRNEANEIIGVLGVYEDITERKRSADMLRLRESYLSAIIENQPGLLWLKDTEGRFLSVNTEFAKSCGLNSPEYLAGKTDFDVWSEELANRYTSDDAKVLKSGLPLTAEEPIDNKGQITWFETFKTPVFDKKGIIIGTTGYARDISERKKAEEELRKSDATFRKLFEESSDAILLIDSSGVFVECNQAALDLLKMSREQFLFLPPARISPEFQPNGRRSDEAALEMIEQAYRKGLHRFDWTCVNAEGGEFIVEVSLMPITIKGQIMLHTTWRDITERTRNEERLKLSEQKFSRIFNIMPDMIGITGMEDGRFVEVNPGFERWSGWRPEEVIGKSSLDLGLWTREARAKAVAILKKEGHLEGFDFMLGTKSGEKRNALMYLLPITVDGEKCLFFMARDTTDRIQAEEQRISMEKQMLHAQKLESLGVLAGGIAHDFNNLLTAIMGNADLALMRLNKESPAVDNLRKIEQATARAADLAKQMLAYSGKGKFVIEAIDLNKLIEEMFHMLEVSISKKAVLRFNPYHPLPAVEADATNLRQIIMNLVINASEAIGDKSGVIAVNTGCMECSEAYLQNAWLSQPIPEDLYVYLEIADTGCGMDKETLEKIFDPFFTTKFTGRGLGMAAVLGIVRSHKGAIKVYSEPGRGSNFKILLPASSRPIELFNEDSGHDDWYGSGTVLLVDDEETVRGVGAEMLRELGFKVITANNGREALDRYCENPGIGLVILDLTMPHMDGEQCFRELRQLNPNVRVIVSSGFSEQEVTQKFVGKGLAGFIQKLYKLSVLRDETRKATTT
jgi:two-component system cell cycle sensor histidine kinase/response regulator CckA